MGREVKIFDLAAPCHFAGAGTENKWFAGFRTFQTPSRSVRVGITDEKDRLVFVIHHSDGEIMGGGIFSHHSRCNDKDMSAAEPHFLSLPLFENNEFQCFMQLQIRMLP